MSPRLSIAILLSSAISSCSSGEGGDGGGNRCVPGRSVSCSCTNGSTGAQECASNGTYLPCSCDDIDAGALDTYSDSGASVPDSGASVPDSSAFDAGPDAGHDAGSTDAYSLDVNDGGPSEDAHVVRDAEVVDVGAQWSSPTLLSSDIDALRISTDGSGTWIIIGEDASGDLWIIKSTDRGVSWGSPNLVHQPPPLRHAYYPDIETDGNGNWVMTWSSNDPLGGSVHSDYDIFIVTSTDGASTWSIPTTANSNASGDVGNDFWPSVKSDRNGTWFMIWQSNDPLGLGIGTDYDIMISRSFNNGASWSPPSPLNTNAAIDTVSDGDHKQIETDGNGVWVASWKARYPNNNRAMVSRSNDDGSSWSDPIEVTPFRIEQLDLATDRLGSWFLIFQSNHDVDGLAGTDQDVFVSRSIDNGLSWSDPFPVNSDATTDVLKHDIEPQVAIDSSGSLLAVWRSRDIVTWGDDAEICFSASSDGLHWSPHAPTRTNAATDDLVDMVPKIATDGDGLWIAVWRVQGQGMVISRLESP